MGWLHLFLSVQFQTEFPDMSLGSMASPAVETQEDPWKLGLTSKCRVLSMGLVGFNGYNML